MHQLNPQQQRAVLHDTGPLLILAGAGTGKTRVVTERMARLLRSGVPPAHILGVTFTNKAANEMRERVAALLGKRKEVKDLIISTFHSLAVRIIRRNAEDLGFTRHFTIADYGEQSAALRKAAATVRGGATVALDEAMRRISGMKNQGLSPEQCSRTATEEDENVLAAVYRRYQQALRRQNTLDFDDLLLQSLQLLQNHQEAREYWQNRFRYIMVDEFQDTNQVQFTLVRLLASPRNNLCVVGDDDQSIYGWRGAMAGNILKFHENFPGAVTVTLEQNYRSTSTILNGANAVIKNNSGRREKNLWSDLGRGGAIRLVPYNDQYEEADGIAAAIREKISGSGGRMRWQDVAVIIRANAQSKPLEESFLASHIPYQVIGGQDLFDRKEARDALSYLAVVADDHADNHLLRIVNVPPRGIGGKTVDAVSAFAARERTPVVTALRNAGKIQGLTRPAVESCLKLVSLIDSWRRMAQSGEFKDLVATMLDQAGYQEELQQLYRDPLDMASRWNEALGVGEALARFAERNEPGSPLDIISEFICEAALSGKSEDRDRKKDTEGVRIITAHSAKGLEYPAVFLPGVEEEIFPHKNAIEADTIQEERRLFYVAMTRARRELTITYCRARTSRGKDQPRQPSRFIEEIPEELMERTDAPTREEEALDWLRDLRSRLG